MFKIDREYILNKAVEILNYDSPSGYCDTVINESLIPTIEELGYKHYRNKKGNLIIEINNNKEKTIGLTAHLDTLGAMVRSITPKGTLKFTVLGAPILNTYDGEYCRIRTRNNDVYTGTFLSTSPAIHVFSDALTKPRDEKNMEIRIDEVVKNKVDVLALGISVGDYICLDTKTVVTPSGFLKSRFIDDKASVAILLGFLKAIKDNSLELEYNIKIIFSVYEEVGFGSSHIPQDIDEFIAVDMGCIGEDLGCSEYDVSICAKDSSGPYDYNMITKMVNLSRKHGLNHVVDIYPRYSSDASAALRGGNDIRAALIGPGVHASHGMERTHYMGMENTLKLLLYYVMD